uniref:Uncharacterized protein n=1 Tax=Parascaris univalens TaxID=6257 RepID=A0A915BY62_PARUN
LTLGHFFTIIEEDGQFGVLTGKGKCDCCVSSINRGFLEVPNDSRIKKTASTSNMQETSFSNEKRRTQSHSDLLSSKSPPRPEALPLKAICTQPLPGSQFDTSSKGPSSSKPKSEKKKQEDQRDCCKQCCADWGQCCIGLMSGI